VGSLSKTLAVRIIFDTLYMSLFKEPESKAVAIVVLVAVSVIVTYVIAAIAYDWSISESPSSWGPFGDYFGGIINPSIALAALYVLVKATRYQKAEFKATRNHFEIEAKKNELYRIISHLDTKLESMLNVDVKENTGGGFGIVTLGPLSHYLMPGWTARSTFYVVLGESNLETQIARYLPKVKNRIETLEKYIAEYENITNNKENAVSSYFKEVYLPYKSACIEIVTNLGK